MNELPGRLVLLGHPLEHSLSPLFQNAALRHAGVPLVYEAVDVTPADLGACLRALLESRAAGNVTIPHKEAVAAMCARMTDVAQRTGAVNTFWTERGALIGDNTDVVGFEALARSVGAGPWSERGGPSGTSPVVALLGAGGGAAAVCAAVAGWPGWSVRVVSRNADRARRLAERFHGLVTVAQSLDDAVGDATLVVNATPVGLRDDDLPAPIERLPRDAAVIDLAYRPGLTAWIRAARQAGHAAADGREMLIVQGAHAFERWLGFPPDLAVMRAALPA